MARRRRFPKIFASDLDSIERKARELRSAISEAQVSVDFSSPHYGVLIELHDSIRIAINLLHDRPRDYVEHYAPFSRGKDMSGET